MGDTAASIVPRESIGMNRSKECKRWRSEAPIVSPVCRRAGVQVFYLFLVLIQVQNSKPGFPLEGIRERRRGTGSGACNAFKIKRGPTLGSDLHIWQNVDKWQKGQVLVIDNFVQTYMCQRAVIKGARIWLGVCSLTLPMKTDNIHLNEYSPKRIFFPEEKEWLKIDSK